MLAAGLAIEQNDKVRKAITIALPQHKPWSVDSEKSRVVEEEVDDVGSDDNPETFGLADMARYADLRGMDFSISHASDAYWARVVFTRSDFYQADLRMHRFATPY